MTDLQHDIEKYLNGELSPAEMHALEKKALDDPFLADALEGAEFIGAEAFHHDLADLQQQLQARMETLTDNTTDESEPDIEYAVPGEADAQGRRTTVEVFWRWTARIAAGLLILTLVTFMLNQKLARKQYEYANENEKIAMSEANNLGFENSTDTLNIYLPPAYERHAGRPHTMELNMPDRPQLVANAGRSQRNSHEVSVEANLMPLENIGADYNASPIVAASPATITRNDNAPSQVSGWSNKDKNAAVIASSIQKDSTIDAFSANTAMKARGRVVYADDGTAIPGVSVVLKGTTQGVITDAEGYFEIPVSSGLSTLQLAYVGMQKQEIKAAPGVDLNVEMKSDDAALSEVVVMGRSKKKAADAPEPAAPDGGRQAFNHYIEQSLKYPDQALENSIEGRVTVEFTVQPSGQLSDFKVVDGLGYGCDEEAIRLIKQGPKWIPAGRTTEATSEQVKVKVRLKFALPRKK